MGHGVLEVRDAEAGDRRWIVSLLQRRWGDTRLVSRGRVHAGDRLPALVATLDGRRCGLATYRMEEPDRRMEEPDRLEAYRMVELQPDAHRPDVHRLDKQQPDEHRPQERGRIAVPDRMRQPAPSLPVLAGGAAPGCAPAPAACELVSLDAVVEGRGVGSALVAAVARIARGRGCRRLWLITTNDNLPAIGFYQRRGFLLVAVHREALVTSRRLKPSIPEIGMSRIPLRDELELELVLEPGEQGGTTDAGSGRSPSHGQERGRS